MLINAKLGALHLITVKLEDDVEVVSLQKTINSISVTAKDGSGQMDGAIIMVFDPTTLALRESFRALISGHDKNKIDQLER